MPVLGTIVFFSKKVRIRKENIKENKTTQAQGLQLDCILSFFRDFSADCPFSADLHATAGSK